MKRVLIRSLGALAMGALLAGAAHAGADFYLKIDGVDGEISGGSGGGAGGLAVDSWSFGASNTSSMSHGGGMGQGRMASGAAEPADGSSGALTITRQYDKASPVLAKRCADGTHFPKVEIKRCQSGECRAYELKDVVISSVTVANSGQGQPMESLSLNFAKIEYKRSASAAADAVRESPTLSSKGAGASVGKPNPGR